MRKIVLAILALITFASFSTPVSAGYYHHRHRHPYHQHSYHHRGGYLYCNLCHLYHYASHPHFHRHGRPMVIEHGQTVEHQTVTETQEIVE